ncbi:MAG: thymidine phosphorylase [Chloroflexota bacterium]|nr:thymidine phosphorylase [Chloroflexota bacterium]
MLDPVRLLESKKLGLPHPAADIRALVEGYMAGAVPDYQMSAWLMAVRLNGMDDAETLAYTDALLHSGITYSWDGLDRPVVDKHSSGGVGDKTSLVVVPLAVACGLAMPKISGRGLGLTGGTLDKLESIPGMRLDLGEEELRAQIEWVGGAIVAQSAELVPADGLTYALREVTASTDSVPLIAASIMCKKLATGAGTIVLDVKCGAGAFMGDVAAARELATAMVGIGNGAGRTVRAFVTAMDAPLGRAVGHSLEVREALDTLRGEGPADLVELALTVVAALVRDSGLRPTPRAARELAEKKLGDGEAYERMEEMIAAQGGDLEAFIASPAHAGKVRLAVTAHEGGYVAATDADGVALAVRQLGGGRLKKTDEIDFGVGVVLVGKPGDAVERGGPLAEVYAADDDSAQAAAARLLEAIQISSEKPVATPLVLEQLGGAPQ